MRSLCGAVGGRSLGTGSLAPSLAPQVPGPARGRRAGGPTTLQAGLRGPQDITVKESQVELTLES